MAKTIYTAVVNGVEVKRSTDRTYTHAVVWASDCGKIVKAKSFSGSQVLAQKARNQLNDGKLYKHVDELKKAGLDPDTYEIYGPNSNYRVIPGKWLIVPVVPKTN